MSDSHSEEDYWGNMGEMTDGNSKFCLAYVRLYDERLHGFDPVLSDDAVHGQYLCGSTVPLETWLERPMELSESYDVIQEELDVSIDLENGNHTSTVSAERPGFILPMSDEFVPYLDSDGAPYEHDIVRNAYSSQMLKKMQGTIQIVELDYLSGGETICTIHTTALRVFQRRVKAYLQRLRELREKCGNPRSLIAREVTGRFPASCTA